MRFRDMRAAREVELQTELAKRVAGAALPPRPPAPVIPDFATTLVVRDLPPLSSGIKIEGRVDGGIGRHVAGYYETPKGVKVLIVVDPKMKSRDWHIENTLGHVINKGRL